jgi:hypothetical protein
LYALSKGAPALYDFFNLFKIALGVDSPATPVTLNLCQQTFTLPSNECGAGDIEAAADRACFIFSRTCAFHHGALSGYSTYTNQRNLPENSRGCFLRIDANEFGLIPSMLQRMATARTSGRIGDQTFHP